MQVSPANLKKEVAKNLDSSTSNNLLYESGVESELGTNKSSNSNNGENTDFFVGKLIQFEEQNVIRAKASVFVAIITCAGAVCLVVYFLSKNHDRRAFEAEFKNFARQIAELVQWEVQYNFALMQQMSAVVTSAAIMTQSTFPLVTVPHFEISGGYVDGMGGIMNLAYAPLIKAEARAKWERYTLQNQGWLTESAHLKISHPGHRDPLHHTIQDHEHDRRFLEPMVENSNISSSIYRWENGVRVPEHETNPNQLFAPIWQLSPADDSAVNVNLLSDGRLARLFGAMKSTNQSVLSEATEVGDLYDFAFDPIEKPFKQEPHGFLMEPVYTSFDQDKEFVGILLGLTSWRNLFTRLLPEDANGIYCVVTDSCDNVITFSLNGQNAQFLGKEDLHEVAYDGYKHTVDIEFYENLHEDLCSHQLHVYPSAAFIKYYESNNTNIFVSVFVAFVATGLFLMIYDAMVTRRQRETLGNLARANRLVDSLFPKYVKDRLLDDEELNMDKTLPLIKEDSDDRTPTSRPIADLFPKTTVMFADIAGFTAWCSSREPFQVFSLLETIYGAFDRIAEHRKVYKVETVGDCYVAVCGLPQPQTDHAVRMVRFAYSCMTELTKITEELESSLGPGTRALSMRFGLHSGPLIAGVLRGQNARFQLFGDTMNTASRMESTGERGKIQCSTETADFVRAAGKSSWLIPRKNKVFVKGKGEMESFWISSPSIIREAVTETGSSSEVSTTNSMFE